MRNINLKDKSISRRSFLPLVGGGFLLPFLGFGNTPSNQDKIDTQEEEYQSLLKPDGTLVKIKVSAFKKAKIIKKDISNKSFLSWLGKKL